MTSKQSEDPTRLNRTGLDIFQQLFNDGQVGPKCETDCDYGSVDQILGVCLRLSPASYRPSPLVPEVPENGSQFYETVVKSWLDRDPLFSKAEVRDLGLELDVILYLESPVRIAGKHDRDAWANIITVVQSILPAKLTQPGINATSRIVGSIVSETGVEVTEIRSGTPITKRDLASLYVQMACGSFNTVMCLIAGERRLEPCPFCEADDSVLEDRFDDGFCSGECGEVSFSQLYDLVVVSEDSTLTTQRNPASNLSPGERLVARFQEARQRVRDYRNNRRVYNLIKELEHEACISD